MKLFKKPAKSLTERVSKLYIFTLYFAAVFFIGELLGLYSTKHFISHSEVYFTTFQTEKNLIQVFIKTICIYIPCLITVICHRFLFTIPFMVFCRGYILSCSLSAISYIYSNNVAGIISIIVPAVLETTALLYLSSDIFFYVWTKQKAVYRKGPSDKTRILNSVSLVLVITIIRTIAKYTFSNYINS